MPTSEDGTPGISDETCEIAATTGQSSVWVVILAAGRAQRMGRWKQLLPLEDGIPMLRRVCLTALKADVSGVFVVIPPAGVVDPASGDESQSSGEPFDVRLFADLPVRLLVNEQAQEGQSTSVHQAVLGLHQVRAGAGLFLLGDQPTLRTSWITAVAERYRETRSPVVQARYHGRWGHPVLFDAALFAQLSACQGDEGGRVIISRYREYRRSVDIDADAPIDLDTPQEYESYLRQRGCGRPVTEFPGTT